MALLSVIMRPCRRLFCLLLLVEYEVQETIRPQPNKQASSLPSNPNQIAAAYHNSERLICDHHRETHHPQHAQQQPLSLKNHQSVTDKSTLTSDSSCIEMQGTREVAVVLARLSPYHRPVWRCRASLLVPVKYRYRYMCKSSVISSRLRGALSFKG